MQNCLKSKDSLYPRYSAVHKTFKCTTGDDYSLIPLYLQRTYLQNTVLEVQCILKRVPEADLEFIAIVSFVALFYSPLSAVKIIPHLISVYRCIFSLTERQDWLIVNELKYCNIIVIVTIQSILM